MSETAQCEECRTILEEIRRAAGESRLSPQQRDELRAHFDSLQSMRAGRVDVVERLLAKFPFRASQGEPIRLPDPRYPELRNPAMLDVIRRMLEHQARSGHKVWELLFRRD